MPYIKAAAKKICGKVSNQKIGEIIYFLLSFLHTKPLKVSNKIGNKNKLFQLHIKYFINFYDKFLQKMKKKIIRIHTM